LSIPGALVFNVVGYVAQAFTSLHPDGQVSNAFAEEKNKRVWRVLIKFGSPNPLCYFGSGGGSSIKKKKAASFLASGRLFFQVNSERISIRVCALSIHLNLQSTAAATLGVVLPGGISIPHTAVSLAQRAIASPSF
jgi:hypothetical protein